MTEVISAHLSLRDPGDPKEVMIMCRVLDCWIRARGSLVLAAVLGMLATPGSALAAKPVCNDGVCQGNEPQTCPQDCEGGGGGEQGQSIPVEVLLVDALGGVQSDLGGVYRDSKKNKISAFVGENRMLVLEVGRRSNRMLSLNLSGGLGCGCSTRIDNDADGTCDVPTDCLDALPNIDIPPSDPPALISAVRFEINIGEDLDDLPLGCSHEDNATLSFTDGEDNWVLRWGAYDSFGGAGHCPDSGSITVTRDTDETWSFATTGGQLACLYREEGPADTASEYHGQFFVPFAGSVTAIDGDPIAPPTPDECPLQEIRERRGRNLSPLCNLIGAPAMLGECCARNSDCLSNNCGIGGTCQSGP